MPFPFFDETLAELKASHLLREMKTFEVLDAVRLCLNGREVIQFASNDYLGLSRHPEVIAAAEEGLTRYGFGAGASRLVSGNLTIHQKLEAAIAQFKNKERALVFPTGYMANLGTIPAIVGKEDFVIADKLSHASLIDACRLSGATFRVFPHKHYDRLREILRQTASHGRRLIVTDSVFSMDGDLANLPELVKIKREFNALLMIDEAHGTGVFGEKGRGVAELQGVEDEVDITMGTLSKALGGMGGYVAGKVNLIRYLENKARAFIYTTGIAPSICAGLIKAIELVMHEANLRKKLWNNVAAVKAGLLKAGFNPGATESPILPIILGENDKALNLSKQLLDAGFFVPAMRYPTVPKNQARLRLTVSATHSDQAIQNLIATLSNL